MSRPSIPRPGPVEWWGLPPDDSSPAARRAVPESWRNHGNAGGTTARRRGGRARQALAHPADRALAWLLHGPAGHDDRLRGTTRHRQVVTRRPERPAVGHQRIHHHLRRAAAHRGLAVGPLRRAAGLPLGTGRFRRALRRLGRRNQPHLAGGAAAGAGRRRGPAPPGLARADHQRLHRPCRPRPCGRLVGRDHRCGAGCRPGGGRCPDGDRRLAGDLPGQCAAGPGQPGHHGPDGAGDRAQAAQGARPDRADQRHRDAGRPGVRTHRGPGQGLGVHRRAGRLRGDGGRGGGLHRR